MVHFLGNEKTNRFLAEEVMHLNPGGWAHLRDSQPSSQQGMKKWYEGLAGVYGLELETVQKP